MLNFILCNTNIVFTQDLKCLINEYMKNMFTQHNISSINENFTNYESITKSCFNAINVYIIDTKLDKKINGIELATLIRKHDYFAYIILITDQNEFCQNIFQYNLKVLDYIQKSHSNFKTRITNCLNTIISETKLLFDMYSLNNNLLIKSNSTLYNINQKDILYIETNVATKKLLLHTNKDVFPFKSTLEKCEHALESNFIRSHRSYIVNINHMKNLNLSTMTILMSNNETCLLSTRKLSIFKKLCL